MSDAGLWVPDGKGGYAQEGVHTVKLEIPPIDIPYHLQEDFAVNPQAERQFADAVGKALAVSFSDPRTRLREPTVRAVKERIELCYAAVVTMRHDLKYALRKCFDLLPAALMRSLLGSSRLEDEMATHQDSCMWKGQASDAMHDMDTMGVGGTPKDDLSSEAPSVEIDEAAVRASEET